MLRYGAFRKASARYGASARGRASARRRASVLVWAFTLIVLVSLLAGCADLAQLLISGPEEAPVAVFVAPTPEAAYPTEMSTAARILTRGELVVGVRYDLEPFSYITADSQLVGLEIDLARELARRWLGSSDAVRFRQVRSDTALEYIAEGSVDVVLAGLIHTQDAEVWADFSPPYFANGMAILTYPDTGIQGLVDLSGRRVGTVSWTGSQGEVTAAATVTPTFTTHNNFLDLVEVLRRREVDAYVDRRHRLERARRMVTGSVIVGQWAWEPMALAFRQDDPFFANLVQLTFLDMAADGTRDALYDRWLPGTSPPSLDLLPGSAPAPSLAASPQQISRLDVVSRIRDRGTLNAGYFPTLWPYSGDRDDGVPTGFEVRVLERMAELWLGSSTAVTFVPVTDRAEALQRLERGEVDILLGAWEHTREGELGADFSITILDDGVGILSLATNPIDDLPALNGQLAGVVVGSAAEAAVPQLSQGAGLSAVGYSTFEAALQGLQAGEVAAVLSERRPALEVHFRQSGYVFTDRRYTYRPIAFAVAEGDSDFRDLVNLTLMALEERGIYQELYSLWFDDPVPDLDTWPGLGVVSLSVQR